MNTLYRLHRRRPVAILSLLLFLLLAPTVSALDDIVLVPTPSFWEFLDDGQSPGALWYQQSGNDTRWDVGISPFGYGGDGESTRLGHGPDPGAKAIAYYFRRRFQVVDTAGYGSLELRLRRDDGAVIYLNGVELLRSNMSAGTIIGTTRAVTFVEGREEDEYLVYVIDSRLLRIGENMIAVEVHQNSPTSTDLAFDLTLTLREAVMASTPLGSGARLSCDPNSSDRIGCFSSLAPAAQTEVLGYPSATHTFQRLVQAGRDRYTTSRLPVPEGNDFTGYVPINGSSRLGHLAISHELTPGGVSVADLHFDESRRLWKIDTLDPVDFSPVVWTEKNCSGTVTPWGTVITSEENDPQGDSNSDGYLDIGWNVEIDPVTRQVLDQDGDGRPDKLWALGRMKHENVALLPDNRTLYQGEDGGTAALYKFIAVRAGRLDSGALYVLRRDSANPTTGSWIRVPNTTRAERNTVATTASALGGTFWGRIEDVEVGPDGLIYFAETGAGTVWRFRDDGLTVSAIEPYLYNRVYPIPTEQGIIQQQLGKGADNLAFDGEGNLYVQQDAASYNVWVVRPGHTDASPRVEIFATSPAGSEPTGITFSPDYRYLFISFQHPHSTNSASQLDAADSAVVFNAAITIVMARKEHLGASAFPPVVDLGPDVVRCSGQSPVELRYANPDAFHRWSDGSTDSVLRVTRSGSYTITVTGNNGLVARDTINVRLVEPTSFDLGPDRTLCEGERHTFDLPEGMSYRWENGSTDRGRTITRAGTYILTIVDSNACLKIDTVHFVYLPAPQPRLGGDLEFCRGDSAVISPGAGFASYLWSTGATTPGIAVTGSGSYWVRVGGEGGCMAFDTIDVTVNQAPAISLGRDTVICSGCTLILDAGDGFVTYRWSTGAVTRLVSVADSGHYSVVVVDANGCTNTDTIHVGLDAVTAVEDLSIGGHAGVRIRPNPFTTEMTIELTLTRSATVRAEVFDPSGRSIAVVVDGPLDGGRHTLSFDAGRFGAASGIYIMRMTVDGVTSSHTVVRR